MYLLPILYVSTLAIDLVFGQATNRACTAECTVSLNETTSCATSADPFCGCANFLSGAPTCRDCLASTNTTFIGFFNASYVDFIIGVCNCQRPSCGNLTNVEKECELNAPADPTCNCPATVVNGPDCYGCLKIFVNDTFVLNSLDSQLAFCQSVENNSSSPSASASSSTSATAMVSQSSVPTHASGTTAVSKVYNSVWIWWIVQFVVFMMALG
jgi:hypothetical protein